jgi:hypothetical protein
MRDGTVSSTLVQGSPGNGGTTSVALRTGLRRVGATCEYAEFRQAAANRLGSKTRRTVSDAIGLVV